MQCDQWGGRMGCESCLRVDEVVVIVKVEPWRGAEEFLERRRRLAADDHQQGAVK